MGVIMIRTYEVRCDGAGSSPAGAVHSEGNWLDRKDVIEEAEAAGWLRRGRKLYCPECRGKVRTEATVRFLSDKSACLRENYYN